jgi:hypothetical protein
VFFVVDETLCFSIARNRSPIDRMRRGLITRTFLLQASPTPSSCPRRLFPAQAHLRLARPRSRRWGSRAPTRCEGRVRIPPVPCQNRPYPHTTCPHKGDVVMAVNGKPTAGRDTAALVEDASQVRRENLWCPPSVIVRIWVGRSIAGRRVRGCGCMATRFLLIALLSSQRPYRRQFQIMPLAPDYRILNRYHGIRHEHLIV